MPFATGTKQVCFCNGSWLVYSFPSSSKHTYYTNLTSPWTGGELAAEQEPISPVPVFRSSPGEAGNPVLGTCKIFTTILSQVFVSLSGMIFFYLFTRRCCTSGTIRHCLGTVNGSLTCVPEPQGAADSVNVD